MDGEEQSVNTQNAKKKLHPTLLRHEAQKQPNLNPDPDPEEHTEKRSAGRADEHRAGEHRASGRKAHGFSKSKRISVLSANLRELPRIDFELA
jgi:hypothetical protein